MGVTGRIELTSPGIIGALLDVGADPTARDEWNGTPWDVAKDQEALVGSDAYWRPEGARD